MAARKRLDSATSKDSVRKSPRKRPLRGTVDRTTIVNQEPGMSYAFAAPGSRTGTPAHYQTRGWEIVNLKKDGPQLAMGATGRIGEPVMLDDVVLMQMPTEEREFQEQEGTYGDAGQNMADDMENRMFDKSLRIIDPMRGAHRTNGLEFESDYRKE